MQENFAGAVMREKQNTKMRFEFPPQENQTLAQMFGFVEVNRCSLRSRLVGVRKYMPCIILNKAFSTHLMVSACPPLPMHPTSKQYLGC